MYDCIGVGTYYTVRYGPRVTEFSDKFIRGLHRYRFMEIGL